MFARVSRRWARFSDSLWSRRNSRRERTSPAHALSNFRLRSSRGSARSRQVIAPPVITFDQSQSSAALPSNKLQPDRPHQSPKQLTPGASQPIATAVTSSPQPSNDLGPLTSAPYSPQPSSSPGAAHSPKSTRSQTDAQQSSPPQFCISPASSQVVLSRERELRAHRRAELLALESAADDQVLDELVSPMTRESNIRRVRQVGARDDDDTLLQLPRVPSVSFTSANRTNSGHTVPATSTTPAGDIQPRPPKVRQLPRVSALMPMRSARAPPFDQSLPVSSTSKSSRSSGRSSGTRPSSEYHCDIASTQSHSHSSQVSQHSDLGSTQQPHAVLQIDGEPSGHQSNFGEQRKDFQSNSSLREEFREGSEEGDSWAFVEDHDEKNIEEDEGPSSGDVANSFEGSDDYDHTFKKMPLYRLPTGMSNRDVEREMERAVLEIASDGSESGEHHSGSIEIEGSYGANEVSEEVNIVLDKTENIQLDTALKEIKMETDNSPFFLEQRATPDVLENHRVKVKNRSRSDAHDERLVPDQGMLRRVSSSVKNEGSLVKADFEGCTVAGNGGSDKNRANRAQHVALFEDDYLSFQGFHANSHENRANYAGVTALLRAKRISSVTDSLSEESEEGGYMRLRSESLTRNGKIRSGRIPKLRRKWSTLEGAAKTGYSQHK